MKNLFPILSFLVFPAPAVAAGTTLPDMGQDTLLSLLMGFCVLFFVWLLHRLFPSWRNKLKADSKLGKLGSFNTATAVIVVGGTLICLAVQSFMIFVVGFVGVPILGATMIVEIVWGWVLSKPPA